MFTSRPVGGDGLRQISSASLGRFKLILAGVFGFACLAAGVPQMSGGDAEPTYYIYRGQQKQLALDNSHFAVHVKTGAADRVPAGLTSRGYSLADVESRPLGDWMVLKARSGASAPRSNSPPSTNSAHADAVAIHDLVRSLTATGDPDVDLISPVFRDAKGNPVLITSRLLVGFGKDLPAAERSRLQAMVPEGVNIEQTSLPQPNDQRWQIRTNDAFTVLARANALSRMPGVVYAEPDMIVTGRHDLTPNDPSFNQSWALQNTGQLGGFSGFDLNATAAWNVTVGSASVIVVIFDCGIQQDHPDIHQIPGRDFTSDSATNPTGGPKGANDNHGTWVAGCVSERINNGIGTAGLAPGCVVASARVGTNVQKDGSFAFQFSWLVDALTWAQSIGARVTNNSNSYGESSSAIDAAYTSTHANGMVHFASAGNESSMFINYPSSSPNVNSVAALNRFGSLASFSNSGPGLKFAAPGDQILTTDRTGAASLNGDYATVSGTSFASPYTAATAALIISVHPDWTAQQVEQQLAGTCRDLGAPGYDTSFGFGMPDAFKAVSIIAPPPTPTPTPTPNPTPTPTPVVSPTPTPSGSATPTPTASIQPLDPNNVLVAIATAPEPDDRLKNIVREFTPGGTLIQTISFDVQAPHNSFFGIRDLAVGPDGSLNVIDTFFGADITRLSASDKIFRRTTLPNWLMPWDQRIGSIGVLDQFLFLRDAEWPDGAVVRFDTVTGEMQRFLTSSSINDLNIGLDRKLYLLTWDNHVQVYDPDGFVLIRDIVLPTDLPDLLVSAINGIAADQSGRIYLCGGRNGTVWRLSPEGELETSRTLNSGALMDLDVDPDGRILLSQFNGVIFLGDTSLTTFHKFFGASDTADYAPVFVAFARSAPPAVPPPVDIGPVKAALTAYTVTRTEGAAIVRGINDTGLHCSSCSTQVALPFDLTIYNRTLAAGSTIGVSSNGFVFLDGDGAHPGTCIPAAAFDTIVAPEWGQLSTDIASGDGVFTSTNGVAPFRNFVIEWRGRYSDGTYNNFEVVFYENRHHIDFIYGTNPAKGFSAIGIQLGTGEVNTSVACAGSQGGPVFGTKFAFSEITITSQPITLTPELHVPGPVATFVTNRSNATANDFCASILWDGFTPSIGSISGGPGSGPYSISFSGFQYPPLHTPAIRITDLSSTHSEELFPPSAAQPTPNPGTTPIVSITVSSTSVFEGGDAQFTISTNGSPAQPVTVLYSVSGKAVEGIDYTIQGSGQTTIPPGATSAVIKLQTLADSTKERSEKVTMTLRPGPGYTLTKTKSFRKATIAILNH